MKNLTGNYEHFQDVCEAEQVSLDSVTGDLFHQPTLTENDIAEILILQQHPEEAPNAR